jgi:UDP-glucose 4-epimerase
VRALVQNRIGSIEKAVNEIQFKHKINLEEGLIKLIKWRSKNAIRNI